MINCLRETAEAIGISGHRVNFIQPGKSFNSRYFKILPFSLNHDVPCVGFIIQHEESGNILFLTDTYYSAYRFRNLNNIIIEANYDKEILDSRLRNGSTIAFLRDRVMKSHMSLDTTKQLLKCNDLGAVNNIVLIHLSDNHSHAAKFKSEVTEITGKQVFIAEAGMEISLNKTPI